MVLIAFTGKAGAGKGTAALALHGQTSCITSIAEPLKNAASQLFHFTSQQLYDQQEKEKIDPRWGKSPREILQWLGTDVLRNQFDKEIFTKLLQYRVCSLCEEYDHVIIDDVRYDNEAELIKQLGGVVIRIVRETDAPMTAHPNHESEHGISDSLVNATIENNGSIEEFELKVIATVNGLHMKDIFEAPKKNL